VAEPYLEAGPDPSGGNATYLTADQLGVGRLAASRNVEGEWVLSSADPLAFGTVAFKADDEQQAIEHAKAWLANHIEQEHPDLFE
jgi:hypothetical protein